MGCKQMTQVAVLVFFLMMAHVAIGQEIDGQYGASTKWGSGWIDLRVPTTFQTGTCLRLIVGGSASKVAVRLMRVDDDPNEAVGLVGAGRELTNDRELLIRLNRRYDNIKQISVHGNPRAWYIDLGTNNGPATLDSVEVVTCPSPSQANP